ncbi:hypothetical protein DCC39_16005 [Pueribacillus theae]|uniref:Uncharacterized protein n=1 Tax=Pueribacillus theae TaxID=2171751 RepID=A0A2U1JSP9_9BACI|nr:hypothetical protein DCC39_16005 [Pueribacillus theae]
MLSKGFASKIAISSIICLKHYNISISALNALYSLMASGCSSCSAAFAVNSAISARKALKRPLELNEQKNIRLIARVVNEA